MFSTLRLCVCVYVLRTLVDLCRSITRSLVRTQNSFVEYITLFHEINEYFMLAHVMRTLLLLFMRFMYACFSCRSIPCVFIVFERCCCCLAAMFFRLLLLLIFRLFLFCSLCYAIHCCVSFRLCAEKRVCSNGTWFFSRIYGKKNAPKQTKRIFMNILCCSFTFWLKHFYVFPFYCFVRYPLVPNAFKTDVIFAIKFRRIVHPRRKVH